jgi:SAM-dependent methyltransferase
VFAATRFRAIVRDLRTMEATPQSFWLEHLDGASAYIDWVFQQVRPHLGDSILEVGCGTGTYSALLGRTGARVVAMDLDPGFVRQARSATASMNNVEVRLGDVTSAEWESEFDTVVMLDVLEHLDDDTAMLRALCRGLRAGGRIAIKVPAFRWLFGSLDEAVGHRRRYDRSALEKVFLQAGFVRPRTWYFNALAIPGWWLSGSLLRRSTPPAGQLALMDRLVPVLRAVDVAAHPLLGLSLFGVAEKP